MRSLPMAIPLTFLAACSSGGTTYTGPTVPVTGPAPSTELAVQSRSSLAGQIPDASNYVGITQAPDGTLLVLDAWAGLFAVQDEGLAAFATGDELTPTDGFDRRPFTDIASLGDGTYAITVMSDGLLFDSSSKVTTQHFCYEPGFQDDWVVQYQLTDSVAFDGAHIYAQPQTLTDSPQATDVGTFDRSTGEPLSWSSIVDPTFRATAMSALGEGQFILARGSVLYDYNFGDELPTARVDLKELGVDSITGMTRVGDALWLVDGLDSELVSIINW